VPSIDAHLEQAQGNQQFYLDVLGGENSTSPEWAMTALFYAAVHYVQAGCIHIDPAKSPWNHETRKAAVKEHFRGIAAAYSRLYQDSRDARYECRKHKSSDLRNGETLLARIAAAVGEKVSQGT
jgi:hypothetical protein